MTVVPDSGCGDEFVVMDLNFSGDIHEKLSMLEMRGTDSTKQLSEHEWLPQK
jgi:hypothetical protein